MKYIRKFATEAEYSAATPYYPSVSWVVSGDTVHYDKEAPIYPNAIITYEHYVKLEENDINTEQFRGRDNSQLSIVKHTFENGTGTIVFNNDVIAVGNGIQVFNNEFPSSLELPNSVQRIGNSAFAYSGLQSISLPSGLTSIGDGAFEYTQLQSISLPSGLTSIGDGAFNSTYISSIIIPSGVTAIGDYTFANCSMLNYFTIPNSVVSIGSYAFNASSLRQLNIGSGVTSIGNAAFQNCINLGDITCNATTAPTLGNYVFGNVDDYGTLHVPQGCGCTGSGSGSGSGGCSSPCGYDTWKTELGDWSIAEIS